MALPFIHPSTIYIAGLTGSGKTEFVSRVLRQEMIQPPPTRVIWVYSRMQPAYEGIRRLMPHIEFSNQFDEGLLNRLSVHERNLVILDDQMQKLSGKSSLGELFTEGSHHCNLTVMFLIQNMFHQGKAMRDVSLNSQYMVVFKNPRDQGQIQSLALQMNKKNPARTVDAYANATKEPYGYLVFDFKTGTIDELALRSHIFPDEQLVVYAPSSTPSPMPVQIPQYKRPSPSDSRTVVQ